MSENPTDYAEYRKRIRMLIVNLNARWVLYKELFEPAEHVPILDQSAPLVWTYLRDGLLDQILMGISRLLDPETMGGGSRQNFCIDRLVSLCPDNVPERERIERVKELYKRSLKLHRHRSIAHNDLLTLFESEALPNIDVTYVDEILDDLTQIIHDLIHGQDSMITEQLVPDISPSDGVPRLIKVLKMGIAARKAKTRVSDPDEELN